MVEISQQNLDTLPILRPKLTAWLESSIKEVSLFRQLKMLCATSRNTLKSSHAQGIWGKGGTQHVIKNGLIHSNIKFYTYC